MFHGQRLIIILDRTTKSLILYTRLYIAWYLFNKIRQMPESQEMGQRVGIKCREKKYGPGKSGKLKSYINNLHPHRDGNIHKRIEYIFATYMVPLSERVLTDMVNYRGGGNRLAVLRSYDELVEMRGLNEEDMYVDPYENFKVEITTFTPPDAPTHEVKLNGKRLQVIVKFADIVLTPEKPSCNGGTDHVEGMMNEKIVASGIHSYDVQNIKSSRLHIRRPIYAPKEESYCQFDSPVINMVYGLSSNGSVLVEDMGSIDINTPNRAIAFLNEKIMFTSTVPPQQAEWYRNFEMFKSHHPPSQLPGLALHEIMK
ncbi:hypothetical protein SmJEL517_g00888 [Synchytrium microbalum]|uniref:DUF4246 domain-containing protein n=1 Tax=Synchytrium microbalum TaxID=1806994 RepID=A0A507CBW2_9FUNG|nr:uncharacterized protein SmJEL517_g00888 [Synchytrium microbalum]TPX36981.1 hypothetical protein SmJEL517_g00888 [Synchytrium microbalum]